MRKYNDEENRRDLNWDRTPSQTESIMDGQMWLALGCIPFIPAMHSKPDESSVGGSQWINPRSLSTYCTSLSRHEASRVAHVLFLWHTVHRRWSLSGFGEGFQGLARVVSQGRKIGGQRSKCRWQKMHEHDSVMTSQKCQLVTGFAQLLPGLFDK